MYLKKKQENNFFDMAEAEEEPVTDSQENQEEEIELVDETQNDEKEMLIFNKIFMGAFDESIPATKRKLVRIFTSSTFTGNNLFALIFFFLLQNIVYNVEIQSFEIRLLNATCSWKEFIPS